MFYYMGIGATVKKPVPALSEISLIYSAVLVMDPLHSLTDKADYMKRLRSYSATVPIFALAEEVEQVRALGLFDMVFETGMLSSVLAVQMIRYQLERGLRSLGDYRLAGIDASCTSQEITHFGKPVPLTRTESMILRYLIRAYPIAAAGTAILDHAFRGSKRPELPGVRTHISMINKKFRAVSGYNMIETLPMQGYRIYTPVRPEQEEPFLKDRVLK